MARNIPWDNIPDKSLFENGLYLFRIQQIKELATDDNQLTYLGVYECEEPEEMSGVIQMERYQVGTPEDPEAQESLTWRKSRGAQNLKKLLAAAQVPQAQDDELTFEAAKGARFVGRIAKTTGQNGTEYSNMRGYFRTTSPEAAQVGVSATPGRPVSTNGPTQAGVSNIQSMKCQECGENVLRSDYGRHLLTHRSGQEAGSREQGAANPQPASNQTGQPQPSPAQ
jgi:hypothetical protein